MNRERGRDAGSTAATSAKETTPQRHTNATYRKLKEQHSDAVVLLREGDNYKAIDNDALIVARILGLSLIGMSKNG